MTKLVSQSGQRYGWRGALVLPAEYFEQPQSAVMKVWDGTQWVVTPPKVWDGTQWVTCPVKVWTGSVWAPV